MIRRNPAYSRWEWVGLAAGLAGLVLVFHLITLF